MKKIEMEKNSDLVSKFLPANVKTKQKPKNHLNAIEAFQRGAAIEQLVDRKSCVQHLVDSFLFGSAEDKMVFESLCLKWTIKNKDLLIPTEGEHEHLSDVFPVYGYHLKAQLRLKINSCGYIYLHFCFKDEERKGQEVDIKPLPMVTFIVKDLNGHNKHFIRHYHYSFDESLHYNKFGYWFAFIVNYQWNKLISPSDKSMEVFLLVEPYDIINKPLSVDGTIMDTIQHYSWKFQMAKDGFIKWHVSPAFFTHAGGFRVTVGMHLDEANEYYKKGLNADICFLSGEFYSQLGSEFDHETSVTLINQLDATKNITVKKHAKKAKYYWMSIASEDAISSEGFLLNDSLIYCVTIKPIE